MSIDSYFAGKSVLITGGGQGIGRELVQRFHDAGAKVFTLDKNPETIQKLCQELTNVRAEIVDLADWEVTRKIVESFGTIDHLVNNAAMISFEKFMDISKDLFTAQFNVNVGAAINVTQTVAKRLIAEGREGTVVNFCSIMGTVGNPMGIGIYSASKAALQNLTKTMALELAAHNIRVNCILPGVVDSPMSSEGGGETKDYVDNVILKRMSVKRKIKPGEIADGVMFLLSPLSTMVIGQNLSVDGGFLVN